jgi:hypothetical protein
MLDATNAATTVLALGALITWVYCHRVFYLSFWSPQFKVFAAFVVIGLGVSAVDALIDTPKAAMQANYAWLAAELFWFGLFFWFLRRTFIAWGGPASAVELDDMDPPNWVSRRDNRW